MVGNLQLQQVAWADQRRRGIAAALRVTKVDGELCQPIQSFHGFEVMDAISECQGLKDCGGC